MYPISYIGMIDDASFGIMNNCESMMSMMRSGSSGNIAAMNQAEKSLQMDNLNKQTQYLAYGEMEKSQKKLQEEDIKRSFSTFA